MSYQTIENIPVFGVPQPDAITQILNCKKTADHCALMADHHLGYSVPIGVAMAGENEFDPYKD